MKRLSIALLSLALATPFAQGEIDVTKTTLREQILSLINRDRKLYNLPPVELDLPTSTFADNFCREQIRTETTGHYGVDGYAPYMRYSFAGGSDGLSENVAAWSASYTFNERALYEMSRRSQDAMMGETPPNDGHKRTILDPHANYVGIGLAWEKGEFRLAQEFIRRYIEWTRAVPRRVQLGEQVIAAGRPLPGMQIEAITVHHERIPAVMTATAANAIHKYALPDKRKEYLPRLRETVTRRSDGRMVVARPTYADGRRGDFFVGNDGAFSFKIPFSEGEGVYTVVVWVHREGVAHSIAASNISIQVERSLPSTSRVGWQTTTTLPMTPSSSAPARPD